MLDIVVQQVPPGIIFWGKQMPVAIPSGRKALETATKYERANALVETMNGVYRGR
jgi:hypothetical protein